ncbi:hypothetical protein D3C81_1163830 [compost metagenome]
MLRIAIGDRRPARPAVQELLATDAALGKDLQHALALLHAWLVRVVQETVHVAHRLGDIAAGLARLAGSRSPAALEEMLLDMHHVVRYRVVALAIGGALSADEEHAELQLRQAEDQLVDPARHAAPHVGPGALQQQADIGDRLRHDALPTLRQLPSWPPHEGCRSP